MQDDTDAIFAEDDAALHEAGHAVIALHFNHDLEYATLRGDGLFAGHIFSESEKYDGRTDKQHIIILYAGFIAEYRDYPDKPNPSETGAVEDEVRANRLLKYHPEFNEQELRKQAVELVEKNWTAINDVAEALIEEVTLTGDEVEVVAGAHRDGSNWRVILDRYRETGRSRVVRPRPIESGSLPTTKMPVNPPKKPWWRFW